MTKPLHLDDKDHEILRLLQEDAWLTHTKIGERVHLSPSAVQRRVERLRTQGVITGAHVIVNPAVLNRRLRMHILIELHDDGHEALEALTKSLARHPGVARIDLTLGKFDILLTVDCEDTDDFHEFAMNTLNKDKNIRHCFTLTRLKTLL